MSAQSDPDPPEVDLARVVAQHMLRMGMVTELTSVVRITRRDPYAVCDVIVDRRGEWVRRRQEERAMSDAVTIEQRPRRSCVACGAITTRTRCAPCRSAANRDRGSASQRGYNATYRRARLAILAASTTCTNCGQPATTADHITPLSRGGTHDRANLQPMCRWCNTAKGSN